MPSIRMLTEEGSRVLQHMVSHEQVCGAVTWTSKVRGTTAPSTGTYERGQAAVRMVRPLRVPATARR